MPHVFSCLSQPSCITRQRPRKALRRISLSLIFMTFASTFSLAGNDYLQMDEKTIQQYASGYFRPLPEKHPKASSDSAALVRLGERLFKDVNLSQNRNISCHTCHPVNGAGTDGFPRSEGTHGQLGKRNTPTVFNAAFHLVQFWDGRAKSLEAQAKEPLFNAFEMDMGSEYELLERIKEDKTYPPAFAAAFGEGKKVMSLDNVVSAMAAFERTLVSRGRYDLYAEGDIHALNKKEKQGLQLFLHYDCKECHGGPNFGGDNTDLLGIKNPYPHTDDLGRFQWSGKEKEKYHFKVASLRNVALTAPYFHDGSIATLEEAIRLMGWHQKGIKFTPEEIDKISAFLWTLSDKSLEKRVRRKQ